MAASELWRRFTDFDSSVWRGAEDLRDGKPLINDNYFKVNECEAAIVLGGEGTDTRIEIHFETKAAGLVILYRSIQEEPAAAMLIVLEKLGSELDSSWLFAIGFDFFGQS